MKVQFGGPPRFAHQRAGLRRMIETRGVCALLFEPGLGKTATTFDYISLLGLKAKAGPDGVPEIRVLVISPKAAVDTWVLQAPKWISPQVNIWAEAMGGRIEEKAETLMSRGPRSYRPRTLRRQKDARQVQHRALNADKAEMLYISSDEPVRGPGDLKGKPRVVLLSTNMDTFATRARRKDSKASVAEYLVNGVKRFEPDLIVVDELHKLKGPTSNTSRLIGRVGALSRRRIGLTGTVMPHSPMDVFGQWRFINPLAFGQIHRNTGKRVPPTWEGFRRRFGVLGGYMGREVIAYQNLDELQAIMADNSIVALKKDALDLPKMTDTEVYYKLSPREQRAYDDMKNDLVALLKEGDVSAPNKLTQMLRLRQITAGHAPADGKIVEVGTSQADTAVSLVHDTLEGENRIVVFALFKHEIQTLAERLKRAGTTVEVIDGRTPQATRLAIRRRFGDAKGHPERIVLVAQVSTISVSVNELVTANHAIFATLSQRRDDLIQARDRLNRLGQERPCTFWYLLAKDTVDEVVYRSHQNRSDLEAEMLRHIQGQDGAPGQSSRYAV